MAYVNKYTVTFLDTQDRTHTIYLDQDGAGAGTTALVPSDDPFVWTYGAQREDEFKTLKPTSGELRVIVSDATVFNAIAGSAERGWLLRWNVNAAEAWRGWVLADELTQPIDIPGELVITAVCGLVLTDNIDWIPASTGERTLMSIAADALEHIGHTLEIGSVVNWHAHNGGAAVSGNSLERYSVNTQAFSDRYGGRTRDKVVKPEYAKVSTILEQVAGRFAAQVFQADGRWHIVQREAITGASTSERIYTAAGVYDSYSAGYSDEEIGTSILEIMADGAMMTTRAYTKTFVTFSHGGLGSDMMLNSDFLLWDGGFTMPDYWTEVDEDPGTAPNTGSIITMRMTKLEKYGYAPSDVLNPSVEVAYIQSGSGVDPRTYMLIGLRQDSVFNADSGLQVEVEFVASLRAIGPREDPDDVGFRYCGVGLWLDGAVKNYYWTGLGWTESAGAMPDHTTATPDASKMMIPLDPVGIPTQAKLGRTAPLPEAGKLRLVLYNVVENTDATVVHHTGVTYDAVRVRLFDGNDVAPDRTQTVAFAEDETAEKRGEYDGGTYFIGDTPWTNSYRGLLYSSTYTSDWQVGAYPASPAAGHTASGKNIDQLHANQLLKAKLVPRKIFRVKVSAEGVAPPDLWPQTPIDFDSTEYSLVYLKRSVRFDEYDLEGVATGVASPTITEDEGYIIGALDPSWMDDAFGENVFEEGPGGGGSSGGGSGGGGWGRDRPGLDPRGDSYTFLVGSSEAGSIGQFGISAKDTELVNIGSASGAQFSDVAINFSSGFGGGGIYVVGIDTSASNSFKITEGTALGVTPTADIGDRLVIDATGNVTINPGYRGTSYTFTLDGKNYTGAGYGSSGQLDFTAHHWTGAADSGATASVVFSKNSADANNADFVLTSYGISAGIRSTASGSTAKWFFLDDTNQPTDADSPPILLIGRNAGGVERWGTIYYDKTAADSWALKLTAYSDAGSTAATTFSVLSAGGVSWGGMTFPNADGTNGQVLTTNGAGVVSWGAGGGGASAMDDLTDVTITTQATGDIIYASASNAWVNKAGNITTTKKYLRSLGTGAAAQAPTWEQVAAAEISAGTFGSGTWNFPVTTNLNSNPIVAFDALGGYPSDNAIVRWSGITGQLTQASGITIADGASGTLAGSNSGDVTLAGTLDYITLSNQQITRGAIDLATDITLASLAQYDLLYGASGTGLSRLGGNTTTTRKFLRMTGTGAAAQAPAWDTLTAADISAGTFASGTGSDYYFQAAAQTTNAYNNSPGVYVRAGLDIADTDYKAGWLIWTDAIGIPGAALDYHARLDVTVDSSVVSSLYYDSDPAGVPGWYFAHDITTTRSQATTSVQITAANTLNVGYSKIRAVSGSSGGTTVAMRAESESFIEFTSPAATYYIGVAGGVDGFSISKNTSLGTAADIFAINSSGSITEATWKGTAVEMTYGGWGSNAPSTAALYSVPYRDTFLMAFTAAPTAATTTFLKSTGGAPAWSTISAADFDDVNAIVALAVASAIADFGLWPGEAKDGSMLVWRSSGLLSTELGSDYSGVWEVVTGPPPHGHGGEDIAYGTISHSRLPSTVPKIWNDQYSDNPAPSGKKAGDIALDQDTGDIWIADHNATFRKVYNAP